MEGGSWLAEAERGGKFAVKTNVHGFVSQRRILAACSACEVRDGSIRWLRTHPGRPSIAGCGKGFGSPAFKKSVSAGRLCPGRSDKSPCFVGMDVGVVVAGDFDTFLLTAILA